MNKREMEEIIRGLEKKLERLSDDFYYYKITPSISETIQDNQIKKLEKDIKNLTSKINDFSNKVAEANDQIRVNGKPKAIKQIGLERLRQTSSIFTKEEYLEYENECLLEEVDKIKVENIYLKKVIQEIKQLSGDIV